MLFRSLLSTAVLAVSLCTDNAFAAKHGRFGQKARDAMNIGKRSANAVKHSLKIPVEDYQFLNNKTKRMYLSLTMDDSWLTFVV